MTIERIGTFVKIYYHNDSGSITGFKGYQNVLPGKLLRLANMGYNFLNFIYSGATLSLTGDNVTAQITLSSNDIARSQVAELVNQNYRAQVSVCRMNKDFGGVAKVISQENWLISSAAYDATAITMQLSSGLDAVNANTPRRVLITSDVGPLPVTGRIRL